ncbi:hypothetical protein SEA_GANTCHERGOBLIN_67 [Arthrobacter phage GantcherGoblin]|nr:hypothetical protein SEA_GANTCHERGOBLIN_67 [Arthrobacter phage GantcherGoblin]
MAKKKKVRSGNPAVASDPLVDKLFRSMRLNIELCKELSESEKITKEQWEWYRGAVLASMEMLAIHSDKPSAIGIILKEYDDAMLCPTCAGPHRTVKGVDCPTCGCPPREGM